jgi:hypothetical protein
VRSTASLSSPTRAGQGTTPLFLSCLPRSSAFRPREAVVKRRCSSWHRRARTSQQVNGLGATFALPSPSQRALHIIHVGATSGCFFHREELPTVDRSCPALNRPGFASLRTPSTPNYSSTPLVAPVTLGSSRHRWFPKAMCHHHGGPSFGERSSSLTQQITSPPRLGAPRCLPHQQDRADRSAAIERHRPKAPLFALLMGRQPRPSRSKQLG